MVEAAGGRLLQPLPLGLVEHRARSRVEHAARARVDHHQAGVAQVAVEAPARAVGLAVGLHGEVAEDGSRVVHLVHAPEHLVVGEVAWAQVADVLVDPVRHQRADDVLVPQRAGPHLLEPGGGDVPVVVDVVVVEDHRRRDGGQQPPDRPLGPGLAVQVGVLLEVQHVLAGRSVCGAPLADELLGPGRGLVGVDLVAEHQQQVGPVVERLREHPLGQAAQRVDLAALGVLVLGQVVGRFVGGGDAAGAEHHLKWLLLGICAEPAGRILGVRLGPGLVAVEVDLVLVHLVPGQAVYANEGIVVPGDVEGRGLRAEHLDLTRRVGLHPDVGALLAHVAEHRAEDQGGHRGSVRSDDYGHARARRAGARTGDRAHRPCAGRRVPLRRPPPPAGAGRQGDGGHVLGRGAARGALPAR